jgi:hypothetical protein
MLKQVERAGLVTELTQDLINKASELRDITFWEEKNFSRIEELTGEVERLLNNCIQKRFDQGGL